MNTQSFVKSFPPVNDFVDYLRAVNYKNLWNQFVTLIAALVVAVVVVVEYIQEHKDEIEAFARKVYTFVKDAIAFVQLWWEAHGDQVRECFASAVLRTYNAGVAARALLSR
jgi:hypothetical protein